MKAYDSVKFIAQDASRLILRGALFFFKMTRPPPRSTLFPHPPLFRSMLSLPYPPPRVAAPHPLAARARLTPLDLPGWDVGDAGVAAIAKLPRLEDLRMNFGRFSDAG